MSKLGTPERPLRVAIVGSGPAGFFAAGALLKSGIDVELLIIERLPTPYGLVRFGVAPDHPKIKSVTAGFERIATDPRVTYLGNVTFGDPLSVERLQHYVDAIIVACGCEQPRKLGIPGEELPGSYSAIEFVNWYNGHPDHTSHYVDVNHDTAVIVGNGNVALDAARMLLRTVDDLRATDMPNYAVDTFATSTIQRVVVIGRRGPVQAAFSHSELKEIVDLEGCRIVIDPPDFTLNTPSQTELAAASKDVQKNVELLRHAASRPMAATSKELHFKFQYSPIRLHGESHLNSVELGRNQLMGPAGAQTTRLTDERMTLKCGLFISCVGYRALPLPGIPFDTRRGVIQNIDGRIVDHTPLPGLYCVGWNKRGPRGVIGTNKKDSQLTVTALLEDCKTLSPCPEPTTPALLAWLREKGVRPVSFDDWKRLNAAEIERGQHDQRPRTKFTNVDAMLKFLDEATL